MHRFDIRKLIERYGRHCPLRDFEWRLVCSKCGAREAWVRLVVTWKPRNMAEMNANLTTERRYQRQERARR